MNADLKVLDKRNICNNKNILTNTHFLNSSEQASSLVQLKNDYNYKLYGGFEDAERQIIVFYPDYIEEISYPISAIKIEYKKKMSHRDILGSLMGLLIKREMIGDILVYDDFAIIFVMENISDFILTNLVKIGNQTVVIDKISIDEIELPEASFKIIKDTVSSIRLDSVVSSGFSISRSKASDLIKASNVFLNNVICAKSDYKVNINDKISIRGKGKIILSDILGKSKKDRIFIEIKRFN